MPPVEFTEKQHAFLQAFAESKGKPVNEAIVLAVKSVLQTEDLFWVDPEEESSSDSEEESDRQELSYMERLRLEDPEEEEPQEEGIPGTGLLANYQPTHYLVIRSPYAQKILLGLKTVEYRPLASARAIQQKTLAIAVSKAGGAPECGMIIGVAKFGAMQEHSADVMAIPVLDYSLWPKEKWIPSPGGLGVRPIQK